MIGENIKHLVLNLRTEGLLETFRRLCFRFFRINSFYIFSLNVAVENIPFNVDFSLHNIKEVDLGTLESIRQEFKNLPTEFYIDQIVMKPVHRCFICFVDGRPALILWLCLGKSSRLVDVNPDEIEMNHIFCLEEFRGQDLLRNTIHHVVGLLSAERYQNLTTVIHSGNIACIKSISNCGFKHVGTVKRLGVIVWKASFTGKPSN